MAESFKMDNNDNNTTDQSTVHPTPQNYQQTALFYFLKNLQIPFQSSY